jgi:hypothetical protein
MLFETHGCTSLGKERAIVFHFYILQGLRDLSSLEDAQPFEKKGKK